MTEPNAAHGWLDMRLALGVEELEATEDIETYVQSLAASRVALGTASWSERLRYHLGLRQAKWRYEHAEAILRMRAATGEKW